MPKERSLLCDSCGKELIVDSSYPHHFILKLSCLDVGLNTSGMKYAIRMFPLLDSDKHFCGKSCLLEWALKAALVQQTAANDGNHQK